MKNKKVVVINEFLENKETGACYKLIIKKQNNITNIDVKGITEEIDFTFSFKDRNELIRIASAIMIEIVKLDKKVTTAINYLQ